MIIDKAFWPGPPDILMDFHVVVDLNPWFITSTHGLILNSKLYFNAMHCGTVLSMSWIHATPNLLQINWVDLDSKNKVMQLSLEESITVREAFGL